MKRTTFALAVLITAASVHLSSQDALVIELTKEESAKAADLYHRFLAAQADWEAFHETIRDKYGPTLSNRVAKNRLTMAWKRDKTEVLMPDAWAHGIEFSTDFRYAVPAKPQ
jgi:hypothetical protein